MISSPSAFYTLLDPDFFESLDSYEPNREYIEVVESLIGNAWGIREGGFWTGAHPEDSRRLAQGWKVHISATEAQGRDTLERIVPLVVERDMGFKFCSDPRMHALSLIKNWPRTGAGKFITIYPTDLVAFKEVIEECHLATTGMAGPYILSDRPYKDSKVVFYRYGEHYGRRRVDEYGMRRPLLVGPGGEEFSDDRVAHFQLPSWVEDPFGAGPPPSAPGDDGVSLQGRYQVTQAIKFSSIGGIYQAVDTTTDQPVIIREARPRLVRRNTGYDPEGLLEKEARILQLLGDTGLAPRFVDLFTEWEHSFLVQELLEAESLWGYAMDFAFLEGASPRSMFEGIRDTALTIIGGLERVHERGIILRDMTRSNVMFTEAGALKFIDFEFAFEVDGDAPPVHGWTPGYASPDQLANQVPTFADDHFALGSLILDMIVFTAPGLPLNRDGLFRALLMDLGDLGLPLELADVVGGLTAPDRTQRWTPAQARDRLMQIDPPPADRPLFTQGLEPKPDQDPEELARDVRNTVEGIASYILANTAFDRDDRLWPASAEVFQTNPVQIQYGAAGTGYFLLQADGALEAAHVEWIKDHIDSKPLSISLQAGAGGVSMFLFDAGEPDLATALMERARASAQRQPSLPNLYYGLAGWGLSNLSLWQRSQNQDFLDESVIVGDLLLGLAEESEEGLSWDAGGYVRLGFGEGQSGIATFFAYVYAATGLDRFGDAARASLSFDLEHVVEAATGLLWFPHIDAKPGDPKSPHMRFGTAGVGSAALRVYAATGDLTYLRWAERCAESVSKRFTNKVWYDYGMAGYIDLLLDMAEFTGESRYSDSAWYIAERLVINRIERPEGYAYLGRDLLRISCDFAMGSAGIGVVLNRLLEPERGRLLMPDSLLGSVSRPSLAAV